MSMMHSEGDAEQGKIVLMYGRDRDKLRTHNIFFAVTAQCCLLSRRKVTMPPR